MNHSELSIFTQMLSRNRLRKGQNWEQIWDGFGWGKDKSCYRAFSFGTFVRSILSSGCPQSALPISLPTALPTGLVQRMGQVPALNFPSQKISKNPLKLSKRRPTAEKRATKKELRVTQMNHSELSIFTQNPHSTLLCKGQNWEQNWDGFGWGRYRESRRNSFVELIITYGT